MNAGPFPLTQVDLMPVSRQRRVFEPPLIFTKEFTPKTTPLCPEINQAYCAVAVSD